MFIPGFIISILTFPGVIVHELAHQLFCRLSNVAVIDVCYFRVGNPAGYVQHEIPKKAYQNVLIGIGPFIVNTLLGAIISMPAAIQIIKFKDYSNFLYLFLTWLGVSIVMHSFPSIADAKSVWNSLWKKETSLFLKIVGTPLVCILFVCSIGSFAWLDLIFGIGVAVFIPNVLISILA
jgi:hypothetical protein